MEKSLSPFWSVLQDAFERADAGNRKKLEAAFPGLVKK